MNKRAIELYKQAAEFAYKVCRDNGREGGTNDHIWNTISTGKFAELMVEEMYDFIMEESANDRGIPDLGKVKQHLGIEE